MFHTRDIIKELSYSFLVNDGIIPDIVKSINIPTKKYPPFVYQSKDFSFFGMFMDFVIRAGLRINLNQLVDLNYPFDLGTHTNFINGTDEHVRNDLLNYNTTKNINDVAKTSLNLTSYMYNKTSYSHSDIQKYVPTIVNILKELTTKWISYSEYLNGTISYNKEYIYDNLFGHPDVVTDQCVLDIKTSCSFSKMAEQSCLQVLTYYSLMKHTNPNVKYIGFILPMQRDILIYDISEWDPNPFLQILSSKCKNNIVLNSIEYQELNEVINVLYQNTDTPVLFVNDSKIFTKIKLVYEYRKSYIKNE